MIIVKIVLVKKCVTRNYELSLKSYDFIVMYFNYNYNLYLIIIS